MKSRRTIHAVGIEQRDRGIAERCRALDERFWQRRALQKTERGGGMKLDVHETRFSIPHFQPPTSNHSQPPIPNVPSNGKDLDLGVGSGWALVVGNWELSELNQ